MYPLRPPKQAFSLQKTLCALVLSGYEYDGMIYKGIEEKEELRPILYPKQSPRWTLRGFDSVNPESQPAKRTRTFPPFVQTGLSLFPDYMSFTLRSVSNEIMMSRV